jgi:hypothetical protein
MFFLFLIFAFLFFAGFLHVGKKFRKFLFSHFPDPEYGEITGWVRFLYNVKAFLVSVFLIALLLVVSWCVLYSQYNFNWFPW